MKYMAGPGAYVFGDEERKELLEVMETGYLSRYGREDDPKFKHKVVEFERELAKLLEVKHVVATSSGTGALMACLAALGVGPGDEVIVPGYTFVASISAIILMRAIPVLAEIDESLTLDPEDVERKITAKTKAIMPVHMLGNPCDMDRIMQIARKHNLYVVEDCCQAAGASYKGKRLGSIGDISAFSLNIFKTITAGDGGAVATNDDMLYERAFGFHDQGHKPNRMGLEVGNRSIIGMNLRINELTGAVALAQTRKLDSILSLLRTKKAKLKNILSEVQTDRFKFRTINDADECGTLLTLIFKDKEKTEAFCKAMDTTPIANSGWHVYNNMEHILGQKSCSDFPCPFECKEYGIKIEYKKHMLKQTDDILERAVNISIGVVDKGLGAGSGINILSTDDEIEQVGKQIVAILDTL